MNADETKNNRSIKSMEESEESFQYSIHSTAFKIYWYLLIHGESGIRQIQRDLDLSSSNLVTHHLKKLISSELVYQDHPTDKYGVKSEIKIGVLTLYSRFGNFLIPQNVFLFVFFLTMTISYIVLILIPRGHINAEDVFFSALSIIGMAFFLKQTLKIYRLSPL
ncbi:MAG: winged helix-turn-helix domain-containing protein [Candidatus Hodarchaeales archaeon]|jgi:hypothetical protein